MRIRNTAVLLVLLSAFTAWQTRAQVTLVNPDWDVTVTPFGYSDLLIFRAGPFPPAFLHEMLSGEWGAAIAYDGIPIPETAMWLEPSFLAPDWATNSQFSVVTPLTDLSDPDGDGLPEWFSVISNGAVEIRIDFDMDDTVVGTPMGLRGGSFVLSNRYVLRQTYTITNVSGGPLTDVRFFQLLHAHPGNDESASVDAVYDPDLHASGALTSFRYDVTQSSLSSGAINGLPTGWRFDDHVGFHLDTLPDDWGLGHYRGTAGKPPDTDVEPDGDGDGAHFEVERDTLENETSFGPDEVGGSMRRDFGTLADGGTVALEVLLTVSSEVVEEPDPLGFFGPTFSIDFQGPSAGAPDGFFGLPITEGTVLTTAVPGAPGPNPAAPGPLPAPGTVLYGAAPTTSLGVTPPAGFGGEIDALSYGRDQGGQLLFSVDEFATGVAGVSAPPDVASEGAAGLSEAAADVFTYLGAVIPTPPGPPGPGNVATFDGDGVAPSGMPGFGLVEPAPAVPGIPDAGDNLDAFDHDTILSDVLGPVFFSLDASFPEPLEGPPANTATAAVSGVSSADVLVSVVGGTPVVAIPAAALGLDLAGFGTDDLDALAFDDADGSLTLTAGDTVLFSVRRGSAVIGVADSATGSAIVEGDVLTAPAAAGVPPALFLAAEALGLVAPRGLAQAGDDVDAIDLPEPGALPGLGAGVALLVALARRRRRT